MDSESPLSTENNIIFLHPEDPSKSFLFPYNKETSTTQTLKDFFQTVSDEKQHYFKFNDFFSRSMPEHKILEDFRALQPFYITQMLPKMSKIIVSLPKGDSITFETDIGDKASKITEFLEKELNYPQEQQKLFFGDRLIFPVSTLMSQGYNTPTIKLNLVLKTLVHLECVDGTFDIFAEANDTMGTIKQIINGKKGIPVQQQILFLEGKELRDSQDLLECGIFEEGVLKLDFKTKTTFSFPGEKTLMDFFNPAIKISELKENVKKLLPPINIALQSEQYDLEYQGYVLEEDKPFNHYNVGKEAEVKIRLRPGIVCVCLIQPAKSYFVHLDKSQTIADIKKQANTTWHLDESKIKIILNMSEIPNEVTLDTLNITEGNLIKLDFDSSTVYTFNVVTLTGKTVEITIDVTSSIEAFKKEIEKKEMIPIDQQRLIYAGKQMEDNKSILDYNIPNGETVHLVLRLRGGGGGPGFNFADITNPNRAQDLAWSDRAPNWRVVTMSGLCLEGLCANDKCEAFLQDVIISKGTGTYDIVLEKDTNKCPLCNQEVMTDKCAFNNCLYGYSGIMILKDGETKKVTSQKEILVGDAYKLFDPSRVGMVRWQSLKIVTKASRVNSYAYEEDEDEWADEDEEDNLEEVACGICRKKIEGEKCILNCAHVYHPDCVAQIKDLNVKCAFCHF